MKRIFCLLLAVLLIASLPLCVQAADNVDMSRSVSLTLSHMYESLKLQGVKFDIYLVSTMDDCGELTPVADFAAYAGMLDIRGSNDAAWSAAAAALNSVVESSATLKPADSALTDANGIAAFPTAGKTLEKGLYLVRSTRHTLGSYLYSTLPFMVLLPGRDSNTDQWEYEVSVSAKPGRQPQLKDYEVIKVWRDYGHTLQRPQIIYIQLKRDGVAYGSPVALPHNGSWSYTWKGLEADHVWSVTEAPVPHYIPSVEQEGNTFIVTNTLDKPKIPQTGQLNWPVPVMAAAGLSLFLLGWVLCFRQKEKRS